MSVLGYEFELCIHRVNVSCIAAHVRCYVVVSHDNNMIVWHVFNIPMQPLESSAGFVVVVQSWSLLAAVLFSVMVVLGMVI